VSWWTNLLARLGNAEHALERALGLPGVPADAPVDGEAPAAAVAGGGVASVAAAPSTLTPKAGTEARAARIRALAADLSAAWPELSGEAGPMPPQALELALAQAGLESSWGAGWTDHTARGGGDMRGSNNFGARQCGQGGAGAAWSCVEYGDTTPNADGTSTPVKATFRYFRDAEGRSAAQNGARYFLRDLLVTWPVKPQLLAGDVAGYVHRLGPDKANGGLYYYGGFGKDFAAREANYGKAVDRLLPEVAAALGHDRVYATPMGAPRDPALAGAGAADLPAFDPPAWVQIDAPGGLRVWTTAEPLSVGGVRRPMSFAQALGAARAMNAVLVTKPLSDARWAQATDKRITSPVQSRDGAHFNDPAQNAAFAATLGPVGTALRHGGWKDTILDPLVPLKREGPGSMAFYGWRKPGGGVWQRGVSSDHDRKWIEYDSLHPLFRRDATRDGQPVDLLAELAKPGSPLVQAPVAPHVLEELGGVTSAPSAIGGPDPLASLLSDLPDNGAGLGVG
jgi:hypothetical protein